MTEATAIHRRLFVLGTLLAVGWSLACRPTWSADGKTVVFPSRLGERTAIARYDLETAEASLLFAPPGKGLYWVDWLADGKTLVVVGRDSDNKQLLRIVRMPLAGGPQREFAVPTDEDALDYLVLPPVIVGDRLFLAHGRLRSVDLSTGEVTRAEHELPIQSRLTIARRGNGICYLAQVHPTDERRWELGTVDPDALTTSPLFQAPADSDWRIMPMPSFTSDLARVALPGLGPKDEHGETPRATAILVFRDGELETELPLPGAATVGPLTFGPDDVTLFALMARPKDDGIDFSLYETTFSGSVQRETHLLHDDMQVEINEIVPFTLQLAISPDGGKAAITTAGFARIGERHHGLLLVDLKDKDRKVTRVPFPTR